MTFKIGFWNVNGLSQQKYETEEFIDIVNQYDILCFTETWKEDGKNLLAPSGYKAKYHNRQHKHAKAKRNSGGIMIVYKAELHDHLKVTNNKDENILWVKLSKSFEGLRRDLKLGAVYISPQNSDVNKKESATDTLEVLYEQVASFNDNESIILGGDFNARIGNSSGRVIDDLEFSGIKDAGTELTPEKNNDISMRDRVSEDKKLNARGLDLLDFCTSTDLCILNGRTVGDLRGKMTYIGHNGCSTVDLALASRDARDKNFLKSFKVEDLNIFSDHRPITVSLEKNEIPEEKEEIKLEDLEKERGCHRTTIFMSQTWNQI